jgi:hypothetical protein
MCEYATLAFPGDLISREILQIVETWLQCRQQAAKGLSSGSDANKALSISCDKEKQHNSFGNSDRRNTNDG